MKLEWKKTEKALYLPGTSPELVSVPALKFFMIEGQGDPNGPLFASCVEALYALSYAVKMSPKKGMAPENYREYSIYPLEAVWDISDEAKRNFSGIIDKSTLVYNVMIRQPDFVTENFAQTIIEYTTNKKSNPLLDRVRFGGISEGSCVQMMHIGSYDSEPLSFEIMEEFCKSKGMQRASKQHREIYISDPRKVAPEKLKTVLRFTAR